MLFVLWSATRQPTTRSCSSRVSGHVPASLSRVVDRLMPWTHRVPRPIGVVGDWLVGKDIVSVSFDEAVALELAKFFSSFRHLAHRLSMGAISCPCLPLSYIRTYLIRIRIGIKMSMLLSLRLRHARPKGNFPHHQRHYPEIKAQSNQLQH